MTGLFPGRQIPGWERISMKTAISRSLLATIREIRRNYSIGTIRYAMSLSSVNRSSESGEQTKENGDKKNKECNTVLFIFISQK